MWELPCMVLASAILVSALPCCPYPNEIIYVNKYPMCYPNTSIPTAIHDSCIGFYIIDKEKPEDAGYHENENRTEIYDGSAWTSKYCTATLTDPKADNKEQPVSDTIGKELTLVCAPEEVSVIDHYLLYSVCILISCFFLLATLVVYVILPDLRDMQGKCVFCLVLSLLLGYLGLSYLQLPFTSPLPNHASCVPGAFFTYFWMLSAFFWLNISSFNMWCNSVMAHVRIAENKLMKAYYLVGFGGPFLFHLFALVTHHLPGEHIKPRFGEVSCWFKGKLEQWVYFYGIVLVLLILNIAYFTSTALYLFSDYRRPAPEPWIRAMRTKFCVYFKLFIVMGITWIFEIMSAIAGESWLVTDIINCLQGILIFLVMVIFRKRVWREFAAMHICSENRRLARCWERMEDEESDNEPIENTEMGT